MATTVIHEYAGGRRHELHDHEADEERAECAYCAELVPGCERGCPVPPLTDDVCWDRIARSHAADCEWVLTRAHQQETG